MAKKIVWQWEEIDVDTKRVKIMGGWLVVHKNKLSILVQDQDWQWQPIDPYVDLKEVKANISKDYKTG